VEWQNDIVNVSLSIKYTRENRKDSDSFWNIVFSKNGNKIRIL